MISNDSAEPSHIFARFAALVAVFVGPDRACRVVVRPRTAHQPRAHLAEDVAAHGPFLHVRRRGAVARRERPACARARRRCARRRLRLHHPAALRRRLERAPRAAVARGHLRGPGAPPVRMAPGTAGALCLLAGAQWCSSDRRLAIRAPGAGDRRVADWLAGIVALRVRRRDRHRVQRDGRAHRQHAHAAVDRHPHVAPGCRHRRAARERRRRRRHRTQTVARRHPRATGRRGADRARRAPRRAQHRGGGLDLRAVERHRVRLHRVDQRRARRTRRPAAPPCRAQPAQQRGAQPAHRRDRTRRGGNHEFRRPHHRLESAGRADVRLDARRGDGPRTRGGGHSAAAPRGVSPADSSTTSRPASPAS